MRYATALLLLPLCATPALADAVTYKGTLGTLPIIVELANDPALAADLSVGRYAYLNKGVDIPLDAVDNEGNPYSFAEELPCTEQSCTISDDGEPGDPPLGATWTLQLDGGNLTGTWDDGSKSLPITLVRIGTRPVDETAITSAGALADVNIEFLLGESRMSPEADPYDWAKMQIEPTASDTTDRDGAQFDYLTDPRVGLPFPRIVAAGDTDSSKANAWLEARQYAMNADALNCKSRVYAGMGYQGPDFGGTLGGWDEEQVNVSYLSPKLIAWTESGSLWCGGAYPENHLNYYTLDLATGEPLPMGQIFEGWGDTPPDALVDFLKANRTHDSDADWEAECGIDDLIGEYLAVNFQQDDKVTFALAGLPHVINACAVDLYSAPLHDLVPYLASSAENYFPALAD